jgi:DNA-binding transcriptional LysR family regulator
MRELNIAGVDLNLLPALEALLRLRHVTRAAAEVGLSQPAMSRALGRLRALLNDPLLVRGRAGFLLTPRAQRLAPQLAATLNGLRDLLAEPEFDPAQERRTIRMAASDTQTILLAPSLMVRLAREAPGIELRMEAYGPDPIARMENGTLDLAFALANSPLPPGAVSEPLADDRLALVMRRGHPAAHRPWSVADYGVFGHVGVALLGDGVSEIDALLAAAGVRRRIALVTPHFMAALATVAATDLVTTISEVFARRFATTFDLVLRPPPFADSGLRMTLAWSHVRTADPVLTWFRGMVRDVAQQVYGGEDTASL